MNLFLHLLNKTKERGASDLHLVVGQKPRLRIEGDIVELETEDKMEGESLLDISAGVLSTDQQNQLKDGKEGHGSYELSCGTRFRVNIFFEQGSLSLVARMLPAHIPLPEEIGLSHTIVDLLQSGSGLVLVTGKTGQGKSTTLASMVQHLAANTSKNIVTLEDPIEYRISSARSLVKQREVGQDINSFSESLKHIVRQDPDVIMIGEMRDSETMRAALTLAETGHLVLSTLHTSSAKQTINRILDSFPANQQEQIRGQVSLSLKAIISQALLKGVDGKRLAVREVLFNTPAIANLIRENKLEHIDSVLQTSAQEGMVTHAHALTMLYRSGKIGKDVAREHASDFDMIVSTV